MKSVREQHSLLATKANRRASKWTARRSAWDGTLDEVVGNGGYDIPRDDDQNWRSGARNLHQTLHPRRKRCYEDNTLPSFAVMSRVLLSKVSLPLLAFFSTSLLLLFAYHASERPHVGRFRYPDIPPPGAGDDDRLRHSESQTLRCLNSRTFAFTPTFAGTGVHSQLTRSST
jgi:hypothetical protein